MKLPAHKCSLTIEHNIHRNYYENLEEYLIGNTLIKFRDELSKQCAIGSDELWTMQWYPNTPIGFLLVAAPTLNELLEYALEVETEEAKR